MQELEYEGGGLSDNELDDELKNPPTRQSHTRYQLRARKGPGSAVVNEFPTTTSVGDASSRRSASPAPRNSQLLAEPEERRSRRQARYKKEKDNGEPPPVELSGELAIQQREYEDKIRELRREQWKVRESYDENAKVQSLEYKRAGGTIRKQISRAWTDYGDFLKRNKAQASREFLEEEKEAIKRMKDLTVQRNPGVRDKCFNKSRKPELGGFEG